MTSYYLLSYDDSHDELETVTHYDLGDFDVTLFWAGQNFNGPIPLNVRLWLGEGQPADYLANPLSWPLVSQRFWAAVAPLVECSCQLLRPPLYRAGERSVDDYMVMNVTCCITAAKRDADGDISAADLRLDKGRIPNDTHLFRLRESPTLLVVSSSFANQIRAKAPMGVAFLPITLEPN